MERLKNNNKHKYDLHDIFNRDWISYSSSKTQISEQTVNMFYLPIIETIKYRTSSIRVSLDIILWSNIKLPNRTELC